ncbi:gluzincin family metallopeptidase [Niabella hibiscisoli]|uniref:hypothetical protein n=1 Tax=Niabella hibiscisoli TaxID=1825928 RepID=UPI001F0FD3B3|nr:hypothetical protein [Niabella hibiscisoli]MCH5717267.1 hypothetical protein [Niabella hibiscisoli]
MPHAGRQEFYNDFNDYNLKVQAPKNFVVWATGTLQNAAEVLSPEAAKRFTSSLSTADVVHVATAAEMREGKITAQQDWNTWHFTAENITDVTFALSNHYVWDAGSIVVDPVTGRRVSMQAAYKEGAADFKQYVNWGKYCLQWFSSKWPEYPIRIQP